MNNKQAATEFSSIDRELLGGIFPELLDGERIEIRFKAVNGAMKTLWVLSIDEAITAAEDLKSANDVYFGVTPRVGERGTKANVSRVTTVWSDVDAKCFEEGKAGALAALEAIPLPPSGVVDSGNGYHAYWFLVEPLDALASGDDAEYVMRGIRARLSSHATVPLDSVHDLPRILRLPGTLNHKQQPPIPVSVVSVNSSRRYELSAFRDAGMFYEPATSDPSIDTNAQLTRLQIWHEFKGDPEQELQNAIARKLPAWVLGALEEPGAYPSKSASELDFTVMCKLLEHGVSREAAEAIWVASALGSRPKVQDRNDYRELTIHRALSATGSGDCATGNESHPFDKLGLPDPYSCADIAKIPVPGDSWLVDGLIKKRGHNLIAGARASAKSWSLFDLEIAVATGGLWFGQQADQSAVLHVDEDVPLEQFQTRVPKLARGRGIEQWSELPIYNYPMFGVDLYEPRWIEKLVSVIKSRGIGLVVFETAREFLSGDEKDSRDVQLLHDHIQELRAETPVTVVLSHHVAKDKSSTSRGSFVFEDKADIALLFASTGPERFRLSTTKNRWGKPLPSIKFTLDEPSIGSLVLTPADLHQRDEDEISPQPQRMAAKRMIRDYLEASDGEVYKSEILDEGLARNLSEKTLNRALGDLETVGHVKVRRVGRMAVVSLIDATNEGEAED